MRRRNEARPCSRCGWLMPCPRKNTVLCVDCKEVLTGAERLLWAA